MDNFLLCNLKGASLSVRHRLVNATVVQLRDGSQRRTIRCSLSCQLCSRLRLCSTARSLRHDQSLAGSLASSSRSALAELQQSSAPVGWSSRDRETPSASCRALPLVVVTAPLPCLWDDLYVVMFHGVVVMTVMWTAK